MGYISSYVDQLNDGQRNRVGFVLSTVHPDFTTLARGEMFPTSRPGAVLKDNGGTAQVPSVGFVSEEVDWFFFSTWGPSPPGNPDWHWQASWQGLGGYGQIEFDHVERLVLTILEGVTPHGDVVGYLNNPNWKHELPLGSLVVQDHQSKVSSFLVLMETDQLPASRCRRSD